MANYADAITNGAPLNLGANAASSGVGKDLTPGLSNYASSLAAPSAAIPVGVSEDAVPRYTPPVNGGDGFSGMGSSIGSLFGQEAGVIGGVAGSGLDLAVELYSASEERKEARADRDSKEMKELRANLYNENQNRKTNKRADESHALNMETSQFALDQSKSSASQAKSDRYRALITAWYNKQNGQQYDLGRNF